MKYSAFFLQRVISKIWKLYPYSTNITLIVSKDNISAIKRYNKLNFKTIKNIKSKYFHIENGLYMKRVKISYCKNKLL